MAKPRKSKPKAASVVPTTKAPDVEALARDLIERHFHGLKGAVIKYGFTSKKGKRFGRVMLIREEVQTLTERKVCFLVIISKLYWDAYEKAPIRREAALDELLCGMSYDGMTPRLEKHDFKGYRANILRYGVQTDELAEAFKGCQLTLPAMADIEAELAAPPRCDDCGEPADTGRQGEGGVPLCDACWKFRKDCADETNSNVDDDGAHCEGCGSWGLESRLQEMADAKLLCWKCREAVGADTDDVADDEPDVQELDIASVVGDSNNKIGGLLLFGNAPGDIGPAELEALQGVDFTEHAATVGAAQ